MTFKHRYFIGLFLAIGLTMATTQVTIAQKAPKALEYFVGDWSCTGQFSNGKKISSRKTFTFVLNGQWLKMQHRDNPPHYYEATGMWHYDKPTKGFEVLLFSNSGSLRHYQSPGWKNGKLTLTNTATEGYIDRFVYERNGNNEFQVTYKVKKGDTWKTGDTLICKRIEEQSGQDHHQ